MIESAGGQGSELVSFGPERALQLVSDHLPAKLVPKETVDRISRFLRGAPPIFQWAVLELRSCDRPTSVDFLACVIGLPGVRAEVARALRESTLWTPLESSASLLKTWSSNAPTVVGLQVMWFEWDSPFNR